MKILANITNPQQLDIINAFQNVGIDVIVTDNKVSLYDHLEKHKPDYLFLDDKMIIERHTLLQKYNLPIISYGAVPEEIAKKTNVKCILGDDIETNIPTISMINYGNIIAYTKAPAEYQLESDIFFIIESPAYKQLVEHVLVTTDYKIKCFTGSGPISSASIGALEKPQLMALCSSAKLVLCEQPILTSTLILQDIAAIDIRTVQWPQVYKMLNDEKLILKYIQDKKPHIRTILDVIAVIFSTIGLDDLSKQALQNKRKFI